jgi:tetratricopeptide (TPR) repeat protein
MSLPIIRASIFVRSTRIGQLLTKVGTQKKEWGGMEMFLNQQVRENSPLMKYAYENFEKNLRDTVAVARRSGARVIVSTVATNLRDCGPFSSLHREDLGQDDLHSWTALVQQGSDLESARSYDAALNLYWAAAKIDDQYADLEFRIARSMWMMGNYAGAKEHFLRARDLDTLRFRADSKINDINRSVASSSPGAELVDAEAIFSQESPNGLIGSALVYEHVHMTPLGNYLLARAMFLQIASQLPSEDGKPTAADVPTEAECEQLLAFTSHDRSRIMTEMLERIQKAPFSNQLNHSDQVLRLMLKAEGPSERPDDTVAQYEWAIRKSPADRVLHYNYGLFLFEHNRAAAIQQLGMSRPWDGFPVFTPDGTPVE